MRGTFRWLTAALLISLLWAPTSHATLIYDSRPFGTTDLFGMSPLLEWKTIETEHFRVTYPAALKEVAQKTGNYLEEAHQILSPLFRWQPLYKPQVLVLDNSDLPNGLTAPALRVGMVFWVTPPENWFGTGYYDDWLRLLVLHECVHFYNMDIRTGFWAPLRYVFGDMALPNSAWNPWMLEGLAVYLETRFTTAGRGRSPYYEMVLRAAVDENVFNTRSFVTLGQITGTNPYYPTGDTRYQFGYHLMNEVAHEDIKGPNGLNGKTRDGLDSVSSGEDLLGIMSERSSRRIPFLIDNNLTNLTGKDWSDFWEQWVSKTQTRIQAALKVIKSQPTTSFTRLTDADHNISNDVSGSTTSPDGHWIAYSAASADRRPGLFLRNLETGETERLDDKLNGVGMKFTPDSKALIYSEVRRKDQFSTFSDLRVYRLEKGSSHELTDRARTRDPSVSNDGKWVTFTLTETATTGLAIAPLNETDGDYHLGEIQILYMPPKYDHVGNPQFSKDGKKIFFSHHPNGKSQEDILEFDRETQKVSTLVADGFYNRFPAVAPSGELYFVSNATGTDNLFRYSGEKAPPLLVTNMVTGLRLPHFSQGSPKPVLYASVFSSSGWDLAQVQLLDQPLSPESVTLDAPPSPKVGSHSQSEAEKKEFVETPYSIFPSILPRGWSPLLGMGPQGFAFGAELGGFDAVNRHRYLLAASYETQLQQTDAYAHYSNRSFGPAIDFSAGWLTTDISVQSTGVEFSRILDLSTSVAYPFIWTYSGLTPSLSLNVQKAFQYQTGTDYSKNTLTDISSVVPSVDAVLAFSNLETSNLAVTNEGGRYSVLASRLYMNGGEQIWKGLFIDEEHIRLAKHTILMPSFRFLWNSRLSDSFPVANITLSGRSQSLMGPFRGNNLNQLSIRGYPQFTFLGRAGGTAALDFRFPIARIFGGWGVNPIFLNNFYALAFAEASAVTYSQTASYLLTSAGGGLRLTSELFYFPVTFSAEYHHGFQKSTGGVGDLFFQMIISGLSF